MSEEKGRLLNYKMRIIKFTLHNPKYNSFNLPTEDSFKVRTDKDYGIFVVADGITRDPNKIKKIVIDFSNKELAKKISKNYPRPSPAKIAADLFCKSFVKYYNNSFDIFELFKKANDKIRLLNKKKNKKQDYLGNDFWACVASGAILSNNRLYWGFISDCGLAVFDESGKLKFRTNNEGPSKQIDALLKKRGTSFAFQKGRRLARKFYRNNPAESFSYGAITGEQKSLYYVRTGEIKVNCGDYIIFFSDGALPILFSDKFNISKQFKNLKKYFMKNSNNIAGGEATVVAIKI